MKIKITLKDENGFYQSVLDAIENDESVTEENKDEKIEEIEQKLAKWVKWQEYVTIEFDLETGIATVLENKEK